MIKHPVVSSITPRSLKVTIGKVTLMIEDTGYPMDAGYDEVLISIRHEEKGIVGKMSIKNDD